VSFASIPQGGLPGSLPFYGAPRGAPGEEEEERRRGGEEESGPDEMRTGGGVSPPGDAFPPAGRGGGAWL